MIGGAGNRARIERLERQVQLQQEVIARLCAELRIEPPAVVSIYQVDAEERMLVAQGKKIEAIKHHRQRTGSSLLEAKQAIERSAP
ncbi:LSU ribosomal protein L12P homologue [Austwickia chelonae]|uniref:Ribosomal protein L7/L12 C-terminal domain-containing protein n=1 Tax=Austwickia chelonae NBRC 105200 TaxID=1184607 RepID=K6V9H7_9MICO|nr:hypothetical protein [Austwickia chelonae]GAB78888.1 hypothetical protein AUCHE_17_01000 [Austwickia chelonae NBRC 105200]SEV85941.1 LSU ribosomal protein L12P homologue [Austwickia chelonae]